MSTEEFARDMERVADRLRDLSEPTRRAVAAIAERAVQLVPRRTGRLASRIQPRESRVEVDSPYGGVIHNGWPARNIAAQPFLSRAVDQTDWGKPYVEHIEDAVEAVSGRY